MIGYSTIGVSDLDRSKAFYADLLADHGGRQLMDGGRIVFFGKGRGQPMLAICEPYDGNACAPGNGTMVAFEMDSKEDVDALYNKAISLGATDEGAPGQRIPDRFYGAYVRDYDGNKLGFFIFA